MSTLVLFVIFTRICGDLLKTLTKFTNKGKFERIYLKGVRNEKMRETQICLQNQKKNDNIIFACEL